MYHRIGSVVPSIGKSPKFCQTYFIDNQESQAATRCQIVSGLRSDIVDSISTDYCTMTTTICANFFKVAMEMFDQQKVPSNIRVVINETKDQLESTPGGITVPFVMR